MFAPQIFLFFFGRPIWGYECCWVTQPNYLAMVKKLMFEYVINNVSFV